MSTQQAKLADDDGNSDDTFGESVAVSSDGSTALIGAPSEQDPSPESAGSVYVFENAGDSWTQRAKLAADEGDSDDNFGESVAVSSDGSTALVGASHDEDPNGKEAGSVYVFENAGDSWTQRAKLAADDGDSNDIFGGSVAVSGDGSTAVVGAPGDEDPHGEEAGSVYVFENGGGSWTQGTKLTANDGDSNDIFGRSAAVSSDGSTALVGASSDDNHNGNWAGAAYVFENAGGTWTQRAKLTADDGGSEDNLGVAVAVSGDASTALIGAPYDRGPDGKRAGSAYVFENADGSWAQQAKLTVEDRGNEDYFGWSVAVSSDGSTALIGAISDESRHGIRVLRTGAAYVFENAGDSWTRQAKLVPGDGDTDDDFGWSVAVSSAGSTALIGASRDEDSNSDQAGSAYVFTL